MSASSHRMDGVGEETRVFCTYLGRHVGVHEDAEHVMDFCPYCGEETDEPGHRVHDDEREVSCPETTQSTWRSCPACGTLI